MNQPSSRPWTYLAVLTLCFLSIVGTLLGVAIRRASAAPESSMTWIAYLDIALLMVWLVAVVLLLRRKHWGWWIALALFALQFLQRIVVPDGPGVVSLIAATVWLFAMGCVVAPKTRITCGVANFSWPLGLVVVAIAAFLHLIVMWQSGFLFSV